MDASEVMREALLEGLRDGRWRAGHRLPTERELSERYGIGRSSVRRVLAQFKAQGLVRQRVGSGTYAQPGVAALLAPADLPQTSPAELMEARIALEPAVIELATHHATAADFARMDRCCDEAEAATSLEAFEHWDRELHQAIAESAHNAFVLHLFRTLGHARSHAEWGQLKRRTVTAERRLRYQREHRAIVRALKDRNLEAAVEGTRRHLLHVRRNLLGY